MLDSVSTFSRSCSMISPSKALALSLGVSQVALALLHQGMADVVGVLAALGFGGGHGLAAGIALEQPAEQVGADGPAGVGDAGGAGLQHPVDAVKLLRGNDGGEAALHPDRRRAVPGVFAPDQGAGVDLVSQDEVDAVVLEPEPASWG